MWKNKEIKRRAKVSLKANYWLLILICFLMIFVGLIYSTGDTITSLKNDAVSSDYISEGIGKWIESRGQTTTVSDEKTRPTLEDYFTSLIYGESDRTIDNIAKSVLDGFKNKTGILYKIGETITKFMVSSKGLGKVLVCLYALALLALTVLIKNPLLMGLNRLMMESHTYGKSTFYRIFFIFKSKGFWKAVLTCALSQAVLYAAVVVGSIPWLLGIVYMNETLKWIGTFTALAGLILSGIEFIRLYWVGYIVACDPTIKVKEAFILSYNMTKGNFWHMVGFYLSFIPWHLLSFLTLGLLDIFFLVPYKKLAFAELFLTLRQQGIDKNLPYVHHINSIMMGRPHSQLIEDYQKEWAAMEEEKRAKLEAKWAPLIAQGCYPVCYPEVTPAHLNKFGAFMTDHDPMRKYTVLNLVLMFFIFAFIGWLWEVALHIFKDGMFVNRGTMHGPWLPIYGFGGVMIIVFLRRFAKKPVLLMVTTFVLCGIVEYVAHWYLELTKGIKWWDYSNHFINLNGRICLEGLLVFSIGGLLFVYIAGPALDNLLKRLSKKLAIVIAAILVLIFAGDLVYSHFHPNVGKGITDYGEKKTEYIIEEKQML